MADLSVLITGASGHIASYILPGFRDRYDLTLLDVSDTNQEGQRVEDIMPADLIDSDRTGYQSHFDGIDAVVHLGHKSRRHDAQEDFFDEIDNVHMVYNVLRASYDAGVPRVIVASSNHASDWYEHFLIHNRKLEMVDPYDLALSDNFYGWAKASYEHIGFLFACGFPSFQDATGQETHVAPVGASRRMGVVNIRIGAPREISSTNFKDDPAGYKRDLAAYVSPRDLTQLFCQAVETQDIENEHGIPWQVVYGISGNSRAFWSLSNAREVLGYEPQDDSEIKFSDEIHEFLTGEDTIAGPGRVGA